MSFVPTPESRHGGASGFLAAERPGELVNDRDLRAWNRLATFGGKLAGCHRVIYCQAVMAAIMLIGGEATAPRAAHAGVAQYVIQISVDGLGSSYLQTLIGENRLPNFKRLQAEGAWTHNARTDFDYTVTLPNHTCMVTGRPVKDKAGDPAAIAGHNWTINIDPGDKTIHGNRQDYVPSTFDVVHDNGLRTSLFASKSKFVVYDQSYDARSGTRTRRGRTTGATRSTYTCIRAIPPRWSTNSSPR